MKTISSEMKPKTAFFETISSEMKTISSEMKTKTAFFETVSEEMKPISEEMNFISSALWSHFDPPFSHSKIRTD